LIVIADPVCCIGCSTCPDSSASLRSSCPKCVSSSLATSTATQRSKQSLHSPPPRCSPQMIAPPQPILWPCSKFQAPASATRISFATPTGASCATRGLPQILSFWRGRRAVSGRQGL